MDRRNLGRQFGRALPGHGAAPLPTESDDEGDDYEEPFGTPEVDAYWH